MRVGRSMAAALVVASALGMPAVGRAAEDDGTDGRWSVPFQEPPLGSAGGDDPACIEEAQGENDDHGQVGLRERKTCKPAAGSMAVLGRRDVLYWNALEDTEEVETTIVAEFGVVSLNDQVRRMRIAPDPVKSTWKASAPVDGGANDSDPSTGEDQRLDPLTPVVSQETWNDGALFCSALTYLPDGRLIAAGGTAYYHDPSIPGTKFGVSELEGLANTRIYDPSTNTWSQAGLMNKGRWYPSLVPLADGTVFVASGVKRLIKTAYPDQAFEGGDPVDAATDSGRNVVETETFDPAAATWTVNGTGVDDPGNPASKSLPLYPRLHLLPNGQVYFNAAGQVFNPDGYAYDELSWNNASVYDPATQAWTDVGVPGLDAAPNTLPGFRGSTFSVMLTLRPNEGGEYGTAEFLTAGGILGVSPGTYFAIDDSRIDTVDVANGTAALSSRATGDMSSRRWYSTGVLTPTGEVIAFSGATADEVVGPGTAIPVTTPELFDPTTETWRPLAPAGEARTYHNTAALLPDGSILVGGHAPISTLYGNNTTLVPGVTSPQETRNPTFEIFQPPYLAENRGPRPEIDEIDGALRPGGTLEIELDDGDAEAITSVVLMRRTAITHLVDGGQRAVELRILKRDGDELKVAMPDEAGAVPPGPYFLFVNKQYPKGPVPSVGESVDVRPATSPSHRRAASATSGPHHASPFNGVSIETARASGGTPVDSTVAFHEIAEITGIAAASHHHAPAAAVHDHATHEHGIPTAAAAAAAALGAVTLWLIFDRRRRATV